jgi:hypothetical protein
MYEFLQQLLLIDNFWLFMFGLTTVACKLIKSPN